MSKKEMFTKLCSIMAEMEDVITIFESLGFVVEPGKKDTVSNSLYNTCSTAYAVAKEFLNTPNVETENDVCNELLTANSKEMPEIAERIWGLYGVE